jgi:hypothetical protein
VAEILLEQYRYLYLNMLCIIIITNVHNFLIILKLELSKNERIPFWIVSLKHAMLCTIYNRKMDHLPHKVSGAVYCSLQRNIRSMRNLYGYGNL